MIAPAQPDPMDHSKVIDELLQETDDTIVGRKLILKDINGKPRVVVDATPDGGKVFLIDPDSKRVKAVLGACGAVAALSFADDKGHDRIYLGTSGILAEFVVRDVSNNPIVNISV